MFQTLDRKTRTAIQPVPEARTLTIPRRIGAAVAALAAVGAIGAGAAAVALHAIPGAVVLGTALVGGALALVQGTAASDRRGRRRFVGIGLALVAVAVALAPLGALGWLAGLLLGIGAVMASAAAAAWVRDAVGSAGAAVAAAVVMTGTGIATGILAPWLVVLIAVGAVLLGTVAAPETVTVPRTPVFVVPGRPDWAGRPAALPVVAALAGAVAVLSLIGLSVRVAATAGVVVVLLVLLSTLGRRAPHDSVVAEPGTRAYKAAVAHFDATATLTPARAATVATVEGVQRAIATAREQGLGVSMHSTGHAAMGHGDLSGQLLLRVQLGGGVTVDPARRLARIPAGTKWIEVVEALRPYGLAVPHGSSGDVGVVGYLTRGGMSAYGRTTGVAANSIQSIEIVTADGELRVVDRDRDARLFWALRGGGGGFGVVTAVTVRLFAPGTVVTGTALWELADAERVAAEWADWSTTAPSAITTSLRVMGIAPLPGMPFALSRRPLLAVDGTAVDDDVDARDAAGELLPRLRRVARPVLDTWQVAEAAEVANTHMDPPFAPAHSSTHALLGERSARDADQARAIVGAMVDAASGAGLQSVELRQLGGRLAEAPADAGAVGHYRGAFGLFTLALHGKAGAAAAAERIDGLWSQLSPWATGYTAPTLVSERTRPARSFPLEVAMRVDEVRRDVDPDGLFRADVAPGAAVPDLPRSAATR